VKFVEFDVPEFEYQFRREQRVDFTITADTREDADDLADDHIQNVDLDSPDDNSDDPGELEFMGVDHVVDLLTGINTKKPPK
jgi:hypothetical protein